MSQQDRQQEKRHQAVRRELTKLCDKTEKTLVPLQRVLVSAVTQAGNPDVMDRIDRLQQQLSMVNGALHQLQSRRYQRNGGASARIAARLVNDMGTTAGNSDSASAASDDGKQGTPSFTGKSPDYPLADALSFLQNHEKSGQLQIRLTDETITFGIDKGQIVQTATDTARRGERLGDILIDNGAVQFEQMLSHIDSHRGANKLLGTALVEDGIVTEQALTTALVEQVQRRFDRVFAQETCAFAFFENVPTATSGLRFDIGEFLVDAGHTAPAPTAPGTAPAFGSDGSGSSADVWGDYGVPPERKFQGTPSDAWNSPESR